MKKAKFLLTATTAVLGLCAVTSCGTSADYTIGVLQLMTHDALGAATDGFKDYINENTPDGKTVEIIVKNPENDTTSMQTMANQLVRKCDIVMGNATPAITQLVTSRATEGLNDLPLLFTSVTDPVTSNIIPSLTSRSGYNITGTSDINPVEAQIELMFEINPNTAKIGYLYNISETNSKAQCDMADAYLTTYHSICESVTKTVSEQSQIAAAAQYLVNQGCDFIYLPTDNLMASNMSTISNVTNPAGVPLICGESGMVTNGGTFTYSISYYELGRLTGQMACDILFNGKKADDIEVVGLTDASKMEFAYNGSAINQLNLNLSDEFKNKYNIE